MIKPAQEVIRQRLKALNHDSAHPNAKTRKKERQKQRQKLHLLSSSIEVNSGLATIESLTSVNRVQKAITTMRASCSHCLSAEAQPQNFVNEVFLLEFKRH